MGEVKASNKPTSKKKNMIGDFITYKQRQRLQTNSYQNNKLRLKKSSSLQSAVFLVPSGS